MASAGEFDSTLLILQYVNTSLYGGIHRFSQRVTIKQEKWRMLQVQVQFYGWHCWREAQVVVSDRGKWGIFCMVSRVIGARIGFIQRCKLIKKVKTGRGARPDDGELTFKCILNKRDFEFHIVC